MIVQRAAARGITPKDYMSGNLIGVEVTARDIADAFLHLALMDKVNAAVLTVDGGAIATAMRCRSHEGCSSRPGMWGGGCEANQF